MVLLPAPKPMLTIPRLSRAAARIAAALAVIALSSCHSAGGAALSDPPDLGLFREVIRQVEGSYVAPVGRGTLIEDALKGMLTRLDPHSDYMDEQQYRQLMSAAHGEFGGIGVELTLQGAVPQVIAPIDGTPAANAGIQPGDRIVRVDGQATAGMDSEEIVKRLRGAVGSRVVLTIARGQQPPFEVPLVRAIIHVQSVKAQLKPNQIGYIRISTFAENTPADVAAALARLKQEAHGRLYGLVLDLRNDPGGLLDSAVAVAGDFLDGGIVVTTRGRDQNDNHTYTAPVGGDLLRGKPIVVLINSASASAAEIVAGALQDHRRVTVMGTRSFGKGSVQSIIPLDGHGALRLTTALYYTPSGRSIQGQGISPDIVVRLPSDEQVADAVVSYESDLYGALKNGGTLTGGGKRAGAAAASTANDRPINPLLIGTDNDAQLSAALDYLRHGARRGVTAQRRG
jgi:carboxyl-terminal processing protease